MKKDFLNPTTTTEANTYMMNGIDPHERDTPKPDGGTATEGESEEEVDEETEKPGGIVYK